MAKFDFEMDSSILDKISDNDFLASVAEEAIESVIPQAEQIVKNSIRRVVKDKSRTELINSFKPSKIKGDVQTGDVTVFIRATGKPKRSTKYRRSDRKSTRKTTNNDIAYWLENGNSHQGAKPFIEGAAKEIQPIVEEAIESKISQALS